MKFYYFCLQLCTMFEGATYIFFTYCCLCCKILICPCYQVYDFTVVMEGISDREDQLKSVPSGLFSCKSIFDNAISVKGRNLAIYLYCRLKDELYRSRAVYPGFSYEENFKDLSGRFHLLNVTHKFPMLQKVCSCAI